MHSSITRAWVEVDLGALLRNGSAIAAHAGVNIVPMVKADAYGLGAVAVARALEQIEPWGFGVATIAEGEELRRAAIERPIVVFSPLLTADFDAALRANLTPTLGAREPIERWCETGQPWQLAIDTGMSRAGVPWDEIDALRDVIARCPPQAAFTHFHSAEREDETRESQEGRLEQALSRLAVRPPLIHAENGAAMEHRAPSKWGLARPGIFLYGVSSGNSPTIRPEPVVSLRARVIDMRTIAPGETVSYGATYRAPTERRIATLGIGYADGYRRALGNRASVLLHGRRARVVGVVTMDMTMIDVSDVQCEIGDIATLIGSDGADHIDVAEIAELGSLSPYEILTGLRGRLPRRYVGEDE